MSREDDDSLVLHELEWDLDSTTGSVSRLQRTLRYVGAGLVGLGSSQFGLPMAFADLTASWSQGSDAAS